MATSSSTSESQVKLELACLICKELFTRPKVLPCGHTFCQGCLQELQASEPKFRCPTCRREVNLPRKGIAGLSDNILAVSMCDLQVQQETPSVPLPAESTVPQPAKPSSKMSFHLFHHGNKRKWKLLKKFGRMGSEIEEFKGPRGALVSNEGEIFVADQKNQRIQVFTMQGEFVHQFPTVISAPTPVPRREPGFMECCIRCWSNEDEEDLTPVTENIFPHDVAMDGEGNLWVVGRAASDDVAVLYNKQGRELKKFRLRKTTWDRGVAVDTRRNHILVTEIISNRGEVQVFQPDGTRVRAVGLEQGMKRSQYVTVDGEGNIVVSDRLLHCVFVYNKDGHFLFQFGEKGDGKGQLKNPCGICTDSAGNIIVADCDNNRVEMFDKKGNFKKHITKDMNRALAVAMAPQGEVVVTGCNSVSIFKCE